MRATWRGVHSPPYQPGGRFLQRWMVRVMSHQRLVNLIVSNLPGPLAPLTFAGPGAGDVPNRVGARQSRHWCWRPLPRRSANVRCRFGCRCHPGTCVRRRRPLRGNSVTPSRDMLRSRNVQSDHASGRRFPPLGCFDETGWWVMARVCGLPRQDDLNGTCQARLRRRFATMLQFQQTSRRHHHRVTSAARNVTTTVPDGIRLGQANDSRAC
jgi:hypothetical protein